MIKRMSEVRTKHYDGMLGGDLYVDAHIMLETEELMGAGSFFARASMPPGASIGYHEQKCNPEGDYEIYYIISGKALVCCDGEESVLGPGDLVLCPNSMWNGMTNIGDTDLVFLAIILHKNDCVKT
jgi:mannose-6-phosphate isomerase-like protein (cupin superfamily)